MNKYIELFEYMQSEHKKILLESELEDIVRLASRTTKANPEGSDVHCSDAMATLLEDLRRNQRAFFGSKTGSAEKANAMKESMRLEKQLDQFLASRKKAAMEPPSLFT